MKAWHSLVTNVLSIVAEDCGNFLHFKY